MISLPYILLLSILAALAAGAVITRAVLEYCLRNEILDSPNARSSHAVPTPRGGGLSISIAGIVAAVAVGVVGWMPLASALALAGGAALVTWIGWRDDHEHVPARVRLLVHTVAAMLLVGAAGGVPEVTVGTGTAHLGVAGSLLAVLLVIWMINLYNFMDGIDGLAGAEAVVSGVTAAAVLMLAGAGGLALIAGVIAGAAAGFLIYNRPPARIFMGDVGSGTLGFLFAGLAVGAERHTEAPGILLLLPLAVFILDATFTLLRRLAHGERVYEAHRTHAYQRLVSRGWTHGGVTLLVTLINVGLGAAAIVVFHRPAALIPGIGGAVLVLSIIAYFVLRRRSGMPEPDGVRHAGHPQA